METLSLTLVVQKIVCPEVREGVGREKVNPGQALKNSLVFTCHPLAGQSETSPFS